MGMEFFQNTASVTCFRILIPWYKVGLFHSSQALLVHRNLLPVTAVINSSCVSHTGSIS